MDCLPKWSVCAVVQEGSGSEGTNLTGVWIHVAVGGNRRGCQIGGGRRRTKEGAGGDQMEGKERRRYRCRRHRRRVEGRSEKERGEERRRKVGEERRGRRGDERGGLHEKTW